MNDPIKFLLVDDIPANLDALEALLRRDGLEMFRASSGPEALELLLIHEFALALIDVNMPGMSGLELAELMRGTARTRLVPIILLTAAEMEGKPFRGYEAGAVDYLIKPVDPHVLSRKAEIFFELNRQRRELVQQRNELAESEQRFRETLQLAPTPVMLFDGTGAVQSLNSEWVRRTGFAPIEVGSLAAWVRGACPDDADATLARFGELMRGQCGRLQFEQNVVTRRGTTLVWEMVADAIGQTIDGQKLFVCVAHDITERAQSERMRQLLVGELNHRVKNTLATVSAIAQQTLRQTRDPDLFAKGFNGRIQALASAHTLLSEGSWRAAEFGDLVAAQLALGSADKDRVQAGGPPASLEPQSALQASLFLHELFTNAHKYGALSSVNGRVEITWTVEERWLTLRWMEHGGPSISPPERRGFGTNLIERGARALGGSATSNFEEQGVTWTIRMPLASTEHGSGKELLRSKQTDVPSAPAPSSGVSLAGRRILVVEDEPIIAMQIVEDLDTAGAIVIGPATSQDEALALLERETFDAAFLDGNLRGYRVDTVAQLLRERGVPFAFVTGYGRESLPAGYEDTPVILKPFGSGRLVAEAALLLEDGGAAPVLSEDPNPPARRTSAKVA